MYVQTNKAGKKEFLRVLAMVVAVALVNDIFRFFLPGVPLVKEATLIVLCCALVFLIYQHYAVSFEYKLDDERFFAERRTGHEIKTTSFLRKNINGVYFGKKPDVKDCRNMCVRIFPGKNTCYIVYEKDKAIACEPDAELARLLEECVHDKYSRR